MSRSSFASVWLARRHFSRRRTRNALIVVAVALSVALVVSANIASQSISAQVVVSARSVGGDVDLAVRMVTGEPFNESLLTTVSSQQSIRTESEAVVPRFSGKCFLSGAGVNPTYASIVGVDPYAEEHIGFSNTSLASLFSGDKVVATDDIAVAFNVRTGRNVTLGITLPNGTNRYLDLKVAGIAHVEGKGYTSGMLVNISQVQWLFASPNQITTIVVRLTNAENTMRVKDALATAISSYAGIEVVAPKERMIQDTMRLINGFSVGLNAVAAISLMTAIILTANCLLMTANERRKELGVMRAVGALRNQLFKIFIFEALFHGLLGASIGLILGIITSIAMTSFVGAITGFSSPALIMSPQTLMMSFIIGVIVTILGSLYPALIASFTPPAKAMRLRARVSSEARVPVFLLVLGVAFVSMGVYGAMTGQSWYVEIASVLLIILGSLFTVSSLTKHAVRGLSVIARPLLKTNREVTVRNIARNTRRTSLTIGMVSIGLTFVIFVGSVQGSLTYGLNDFLYRQLGTDIMIRPTSSVNVTSVESLGSIQGVSHFSYCEFCLTRIGPAASTILGQNVTAVTGVQTDTFAWVTSIDLKRGLANLTEVMQVLSSDNRTIVLSTRLANDLGVTVGSNVTVRLPSSAGYVNLTVIALFYGSGFIQYGDITLDVASLMSFETLLGYFNLPAAVGQATGRENTDGLILVKVDPNEKPNSVAERIRTSGQLGAAGNLNILTSEFITQSFATVASEIVLLFQMLLIVSIIIALLGLSTTMFMSIMERRREMGILRAMGMTRSETVRSVLGEALILGTGGLVLGFADALLLTWIFLTAVSSFGFYLPFVFPLWGVIIAVGLTVMISLLSGAYPARVTSKLKIVEAIRYE